MSQVGTIELIIREISKLLEPLANAAVEGVDGIISLSKEAGIDFTQLLDGDATADLSNFATTFGAFYDSFRQFVETGDIDASELGEVIAKVPQLLDSINALDDLPIAADAPPELTRIGERFINYLIIEYFTNHRPSLYCMLLIVGIIDEGNRNDQIYPRLNYGFITQLIKDAGNIPRSIYGWGTADLNVTRLLVRLYSLFRSFNVAAGLRNTTSDEAIEGINTDLEIPFEQLRIPLYEIDRGGVTSELGFSVVGLDETASLQPGIGITTFGAADITETIPLEDNWNLQIKTSVDALSPWGISIRPQGIDLSSLGTSVPPPKVNFRVKIEREIPQDETTILLGDARSSRLELGTVGLAAGLDIEEEKNIYLEIPVKGLRLVISGGEGDGFISQILPEDGIQAAFQLTAGLSTRQGFYFQGSGALEIIVPMHITLGPIEIRGLYIIIPLGGDGIRIELSSAMSANLGVLSASVDRLGFIANINFPENGGNLGPIDLNLAFKPPNGVGLAIDAGVVKGGGYLYFDFEREEYAGALELAIAEFLTLKAIGLITTRMPDGSKGFSLLVIITAEFGSPIQLSFGFTLSGVGGLLGLYRTMRLEPLVEGVRTGAINSVMFPTNVIENAPRIISDLRTFFPPQQDIFLIGPMAKIGWGTPNLVTLSLGIIIEITGNIAILGVLKVALPDEDAALLILQINFMGAIEFDKKRAWIFAGLYESRILFLTIEGQMGVLVAWGDNANFVVSVGGFHPAFNPPPLPFPEPKRIAVSILNTSWAKIRVEGYFAVTSNTAQFGARAELFFGMSAFKIDGHLAFDALFQFSPFYFIISISASLSVKVFGIGLFSVRMRGSLEGPTPWHVEGTGSISLLFFDIDVDFSHTWGEEADTTLPPIEVMPLLKGEYEKLENWRAEVSAANNILVSLRKIETTDDLVLHPVGTLKISQRAVPLDLTIDKVGAQKPSDANYFTLSVGTEGVDTEDIEMEEKADAEEMFAMAQFKEMTDSKKLSAPAYEKWKGGLELSSKGEQLKTSSAVKRVVRYEQIIIDSNFKRFVKSFFNFFGVLFTLFLKGSAVTKSTLSNKYQKQKMPFAEKIAIVPNLYVVASNTDNAPFNEEAKAFSSYAQAEEFMNQKVKENPNLQDSLHVIPEVEMKRAA